MYTSFLKYRAVIFPCPINKISHPAYNDHILQRLTFYRFPILSDKRFAHKFNELLAINAAASNGSLSMLRSRDKEYVQDVLQGTRESAGDWFHK